MKISKNSVVSLHYQLHEGTAEGQMVERTEENSPLVYLHGLGQMLEQFEKNLEGKTAGDTFSFGIDHLNGYGPIFEDAVAELPASVFAGNEDLVQIGNMVPMRGPDGNMINGIITHVQANGDVVMDFNHPMAGVDLWFTGHIESVREADPTELAHGHVHHDGMHEH